MLKWYFLTIVSLFGQLVLLGQAQESDSIRVREIRTGVYSHIESISEEVLNGNSGYGLEVGAYQERKLLGQVYFNYGAGIQLRDYVDTGILIDTTPMTDTAIITHFYDVSHNEIKFSANANIRFLYLENPKVYLIVGFGPEVTIRQRVNNRFLRTRFTDPDFNTIGENSDNPFPVEDDEFRPRSINFRFDLGLGIELNKFNIEIIHRTTNVQGIGLRVRYVFDTLSY